VFLYFIFAVWMKRINGKYHKSLNICLLITETRASQWKLSYIETHIRTLTHSATEWIFNFVIQIWASALPGLFSHTNRREAVVCLQGSGRGRPLFMSLCTALCLTGESWYREAALMKQSLCKPNAIELALMAEAQPKLFKMSSLPLPPSLMYNIFPMQS